MLTKTMLLVFGIILILTGFSIANQAVSQAFSMGLLFSGMVVFFLVAGITWGVVSRDIVYVFMSPGLALCAFVFAVVISLSIEGSGMAEFISDVLAGRIKLSMVVTATLTVIGSVLIGMGSALMIDRSKYTSP
jgi:hypothetical protein